VGENAIPKTPPEILSLKICDPSCGSASFLIAALRYITEGLWRSLFYHSWLIEDEATGQFRVALAEKAHPAWFIDCVKDLPLTVENAEAAVRAKLKRVVVERCIYGVEIDFMAVQLARLSLEFFSNIDPLYRTYGKQEALTKQLEYFDHDPQVEKDWLAYCDRLKALSNWTKNVGFPFGDPAEANSGGKGGAFSLSRSGKETEYLHQLWRDRRNKQKGYADERLGLETFRWTYSVT
jgi:formate-dependent phosphoribosylglycinamide formyltransferase (GAR transformylase)